MSGEQSLGSSNTADDKLLNLDVKLDEFEKKAGIPSVMMHDAAEGFINISREELHKMDDIECGEAAFMVAQRGLYIQKVINKQTAKINWIEQNIRLTLASAVQQYKGYGDEKLYQAIVGNSYTKRLETIRLELKARVDRLQHLSLTIKDIKETLIELQRTKRSKRYETG